MDIHIALCSRLFSAAHSTNHFKDLQYYYFHNCIYDKLYKDVERWDSIPTSSLLHTLPSDYKVIIVGDGSMAPSELMSRYGAISYQENNETPGLEWLKRFADHFTHCVWINPDNPSYWNHYTVAIIKHLFPMFGLTVEGIEQAVQKLIIKH
jgi:Uncharacterized protein conserved in bacteria